MNRCIIVDLPGLELDDTWRRHFEEHRFGGICLFRRNIQDARQLQQLLHDVRTVLGEDALIAVDQEGGAVLRVLDVPLVPSPMAIGATDDETLSFELGAIAARGLIQYGINWNYAPALDVNNNPRNPVIGERSFGSDPQQVARLGVAWALGLESAGVMSSVKHFPGHGDTHVDSHLGLPEVKKETAALEACEWVPFRAAAEANVASFMTAHIMYEALDTDHPATLSKAILTDLLRTRWKYNGVVVTDATDMAAIAERYPNGEGAALALIAGADSILACTHGDMDAQTRQVNAIQAALRDGRLTELRVSEALARLDRAGQRFPGTPRSYDSDQRARDEALTLEAARRSITPVGPVRMPRAEDRVLLVVPRTAAVGGPYGDSLPGEDLARTLTTAFPHLHACLYDPRQPLEAVREVRETPCDFVLFATTSRWELLPEELELARHALSRGTPALHLALWSPYHVPFLDAPALVAYGFRENVLVALRDVLLGAPALGKLPVDLQRSPAEATP